MATGLLLGLAGAYAAARALLQLLYETAVNDVPAYAITIALLVVVVARSRANKTPGKRSCRVRRVRQVRRVHGT